MKKNSTTATACVVGADLDINLLSSLVKGDHVLCEMNGARVFTGYTNPLVADEPWVVVSNDDKKLVLHHSAMTRNLILPYAKLLKLRSTEPAVFLVNEKYLAPGPVYILLQFVSHRIVADEINSQFPMAFDAELVLREDRKNVIDAIVSKLGEFAYPGWGYMGVCRFALRSSVRAPIVAGFRDSDYKIISEQPDDIILRMMAELNWLPYLLAQSNPYAEATLMEEPYKKVTDGKCSTK